MIGWTTLLSGLLGGLTGAIPRVMDLFSKGMDFKQELQIRRMEMEFRQREHEMALERGKMEIDGKIEESYYEAAKAEVESNRESFLEAVRQMSRPSGFIIIDFLNAWVRPYTVLLSVTLCLAGTLAFMFGATAINEKFAEMMGTAFLMMLEFSVGYIFGYRSTIKPPQRS